MLWSQRSKSDRYAIRKEMMAQALIALEGLYPSPSARRAAARKMVDMAIAKENAR
jgi:hypothetical protein